MVPVHIQVLVAWEEQGTHGFKAHQYFERVIEFPCLPPRDIPLSGVLWGVDYEFGLFHYNLKRSRFEAYISDDCSTEEQFNDAMQAWPRCGFTAYTPSDDE